MSTDLKKNHYFIIKNEERLRTLRETLLEHSEDNYLFSRLVAVPVSEKYDVIDEKSYWYSKCRRCHIVTGATIAIKSIYLTKYPVTLSIIDSALAKEDKEIDLTSLFGETSAFELIIDNIRTKIKQDKKYCYRIKERYPDFYAFCTTLGDIWVNDNKFDNELDKQVLKLAKLIKTKIK